MHFRFLIQAHSCNNVKASGLETDVVTLMLLWYQLPSMAINADLQIRMVIYRLIVVQIWNECCHSANSDCFYLMGFWVLKHISPLVGSYMLNIKSQQSRKTVIISRLSKNTTCDVYTISYIVLFESNLLQ